jgi:hypothetical protein
MSTRKEKADKKRKDRATPASDYRIDKVDTGIKKPEDLDARVRIKTPAVDAPDMPTMASVQNPTDIKPTVNAGIKSQMPTGAEVQNPTGLPTPTEYVNPQKPSSPFSDMLAPFRESIKQEKTDAVKMQKYYALTDALNALGKMGGTAIGGAIGGGVLDSAPAVAEYQPSRGYIDAFERARKANDRLRALDEQEFQLEYNRKQKEEDRAYRAKVDKANKEWQAEQNRINREWQQAVADKDFARQAQLKNEMAALEQKYKKEILALQASYAAADDKRSLEYLQKQYDLYNAPMPVMFSDGSIVDMTNQQYEQMAKNYIGQTVGGTKITKENFDEVLRANPQAFAGYLKRIGVTPTQDEATQPAEQSTTSTPTVKKTPYSGPSSRIDYADKTFEQALESGAYDAKPVAKNEEDIDEYIKQFL